MQVDGVSVRGSLERRDAAAVLSNKKNWPSKENETTGVETHTHTHSTVSLWQQCSN